MQSEKSTSVSGVRIAELELGLDREGPLRVGTRSWEKGLKGPLHFNSQEVNKIKTYHLPFSTGGSPLSHPCWERFPRREGSSWEMVLE